MDEGADNFPEDIQEAISFMTHRSAQEILEYWQEAIARLTRQADDLMPDLIRIRSTLPSEDDPLPALIPSNSDQAPPAFAELPLARTRNGGQRLD